MKSKLEVSPFNTKVISSYLITESELDSVIDEIIEKRRNANYIITRSRASYKCEIRFHNKLYKLGLFISHTKDTDLEEPISWWKDMIYRILGR